MKKIILRIIFSIGLSMLLMALSILILYLQPSTVDFEEFLFLVLIISCLDSIIIGVIGTLITKTFLTSSIISLIVFGILDRLIHYIGGIGIICFTLTICTSILVNLILTNKNIKKAE